MLLDLLVELFVMDGGIEVLEHGDILDDFLKVVNEGIILGQGDGAESIVEMRKQIGDSVVELETGESHRLGESIVETVDVEEIDRGFVSAVDLGDLAAPFRVQGLLLLDEPVHHCMLHLNQNVCLNMILAFHFIMRVFFILEFL